MKSVKDLVVEVLGKGILMSLGTVDSRGVWVADVIFIHDEDFSIYWLSKDSARHSQAILTHPQGAGTITVYRDRVSLQMTGVVEKLEGYRKDLAELYSKKRGKPIKTQKETIEEGKYWYKLTPKRIELTHEPLFGFEKKILEL